MTIIRCGKFALCLVFICAIFFVEVAQAQQELEVSSRAVLSDQEWAKVDDSVARGLSWLAARQQRDGSFPTLAQGQPGVTSLCTLAFLAHGHLPDEGEYGQHLQRAIDYILSCQQKNGLLARVAPRGLEISRRVDHTMGTTAVYNHAIGSLLLSETYGMVGPDRAAELQPVIETSLEATFLMQGWAKRRKIDNGGWRYLHHSPSGSRSIDSDLTVTAWQLMFLRSAKNAGFDVPQEPIDNAIQYIKRCYRPNSGDFNYYAGEGGRPSRGNSGSAILALAHAGYHNSPEALEAGNWILKYPFDRYNKTETFSLPRGHKDRYHYGVFECSYAMYQLGGKYWEDFFPRTARTLIANQQPKGSWQAESYSEDQRYGEAYTTALVLLSLGASNQLLPVFQR